MWQGRAGASGLFFHVSMSSEYGDHPPYIGTVLVPWYRSLVSSQLYQPISVVALNSVPYSGTTTAAVRTWYHTYRQVPNTV